jgi:iron complex outermembrane receptor protein
VGHSFSGSSNRWLKGLQATIGMNNVFNKFPPLIRSEGNQSHDISTYDPIGRYIYGSIKYKF